MSPLTTTLRANALSCLGFGALFLLAPAQTAAFLGTPPWWVLAMIGGGLLLNGAHLLFAAHKPQISAPEVIWFSLGDLLWWLGSLALVTTGSWITEPAGVAATLFVAALVATLGVMQLFALGQRQTGLSARQHWRRLGQSWSGLPLSVKLWLIVLNAVFLACLPLWPDDIARVPLAAYVASGPLLLGIAAAQGGLTRMLGIAHLLVWAPLVLWLIPRVGLSDAASGYAAVLLAVVLVCLILDLWDLLRWLRGDRITLGLAAMPPNTMQSVDGTRPLR